MNILFAKAVLLATFASKFEQSECFIFPYTARLHIFENQISSFHVMSARYRHSSLDQNSVHSKHNHYQNLLMNMQLSHSVFETDAPNSGVFWQVGGSDVEIEADQRNSYENVLTLLRRLDAGDKWPSTSRRRRELIRRNHRQAGDSFTIGLFPPPLRLPSANHDLIDLLNALRDLEAKIAPHRPPSTTITVNRHAQFWPHKDSGAGAGQSTSLIVGLGNYSGGDLMVEGVQHCIRYKPLEFDGWAQEHWTLPFSGERFSIVWYIPHGLEAAADALRKGASWQDVFQLTAALPPVKRSAPAPRPHIDQSEPPAGPLTRQRFSMVPPSANLKGTVSRVAIAELRAVNASNLLLPETDPLRPPSFQGRVLFDSPAPAAFAALRTCESVRAVLLHEDFERALGCGAAVQDVAAWLVEKSDWAWLEQVRVPAPCSPSPEPGRNETAPRQATLPPSPEAGLDVIRSCREQVQ